MNCLSRCGDAMWPYLSVCLDNMLRALGPILIAAASSIVSYIFYALVTYVHPLYYPNQPVLVFLWGCLDFFLIANVFFNYIMCIRTPPGNPPGVGEELQQLDEEGRPLTLERSPYERHCKKCNTPKPPRTHHCHICQKCVLKMDHHCPWVGTCVGYYNHRYFFLFLIWAWIGTWYSTYIGWAAFQMAIVRRPRRRSDIMIHQTPIVIFWILALSVACSLTILLFWQGYLVLTNQTTIEFYINRQKAAEAKAYGEVYRNPYDLGRRANWDDFFRPRKNIVAQLMPSFEKTPGNGCEFVTEEEYLLQDPLMQV